MQQNETKNNLENQKHKYYDLCYKAYYNISFSPEKRAERLCKEFDDDIEEIKQLGANEHQINKSEKLFVIWVHRLSRCASSVITGSSGFNVDRANKNNAYERNAMNKYSEYLKYIKDKLNTEKFYLENPEQRPIKNNDLDAKERLINKIKTLQEKQEQMKLANKETQKQKIKPAYFSFELSNNLAKINACKLRLSQLEKIENNGDFEQQINENIFVKVDSINKRVYFTFKDKPNEDIRKILKSHGFKWTPSKNHWGRVLTNNAIYAYKLVKQKLSEIHVL